MSFNILREDLGGTANKWAKRKDAVLNMINVNSPAVLGLQECSWTIRQDILAAYSNMSAVGVSVSGQESGYTNESSNTIIYRNDIIEVLNSGTFWLSSTPDEVSNTYGDANKPRTCTWVKCKIKGGEKSFYLFNAHIESYANVTQRHNAVKVILNKIQNINTENLPVIITGDHNDKESDLTGYIGSGFDSARYSASSTDTEETLNGFGESITSDKVIDHIYTKGCNVHSFFVDRSRYNGRDYISDHYPVMCDMTLN